MIQSPLQMLPIPLPRLLEALEPSIGSEVRDSISKLDYSCIVFVYLEVDKPSVSPAHWVYLPEKHLTVHRISEFKNFSDDAAPGDSKTARPGRSGSLSAMLRARASASAFAGPRTERW